MSSIPPWCAGSCTRTSTPSYVLWVACMHALTRLWYLRLHVVNSMLNRQAGGRTSLCSVWEMDVHVGEHEAILPRPCVLHQPTRDWLPCVSMDRGRRSMISSCTVYELQRLRVLPGPSVAALLWPRTPLSRLQSKTHCQGMFTRQAATARLKAPRSRPSRTSNSGTLTAARLDFCSLSLSVRVAANLITLRSAALTVTHHHSLLHVGPQGTAPQ